MHELSVCQSMLSQVTGIALSYEAERVSQITLQVGPLSGIEPQLLLQAFPLASAGTVAEEAMLVIESLPIRVLCQSCQQESEVTANNLCCRHCGDYHTKLLCGNELLLANLELVTASEHTTH